MEPSQYNKAKIYKGACFSFSFSLKRDGSYIDADDVIFTLSTKPGGTSVIEKSYSDSPTSITYEDDVWRVDLTADETSAITQGEGELYMQIDAIEGDCRERWIIGSVRVYQNATT